MSEPGSEYSEPRIDDLHALQIKFEFKQYQAFF